MNADQGLMLEKADRTLQSAHLLLEANNVGDALNRTYYGAFYAATAVLLSRGESPKTHSGTHARFALHLVRSGLISPTTGSLPKSTFDDRQRADHDAVSIYDADALADALADAEAFVAAVRPLVTAP